MVKEKNIPTANSSEDFLIAEYSEIFQEFRRLRDEGVRRLNFFVILSTGVIGGLIFLFQISPFSFLALKIFISIVITLLGFFGWDIFRYLVARDINADFNMRAMSRIRRYFVDNNSKIANYLLWSADDEPSLYLNRKRSISSIISTMIYFLAVLIAVDIGAISSIFISQIEIVAAIAIVILIVVILIFQTYTRRRIRKAFESAKEMTRFPKLN